MKNTLPLAAASLLLLFPTLASAQLSLRTGTIDSGGSTMTAGTLRLRATTGQPDAGRLTAASPPRTVQGGFWPGVIRPPCPADFDGNGTLNPDDLSDFIAAYFSEPPDPRADYDGSGMINPDDLADYIGAFFAGCP
jgi:hypothetical protein